MIRHVASILATLKVALNITSPSRAFIDVARAARHRQHAAPVPLPWYAARGPLDPYETPELAAAARRVRRLIRRHWWALFFEPESSTAVSVLEAMATPPEQTGGLSWLEALQQLGALDMTPIFGSGYARKIFDNARARAEQSAEVCICGATYAIGDRCRAKLCQVAAGFLDTVDPASVAILTSSVVSVEQCPNCARVEGECQCGDLWDCS